MDLKRHHAESTLKRKQRLHDEGALASAGVAEEAAPSCRLAGKQAAASSSAAGKAAAGSSAAPEAPFVLPAGCRVAAPPPDEQLIFGSSSGDALIGRRLLYRWAGAGWCLGQARSGASNPSPSPDPDPDP